MPPKRRGMRRFFCCGPKDEVEADLPVKPAKQVAEKVDRAGVASSGKPKKEEQQQQQQQQQQQDDGKVAEAGAKDGVQGASTEEAAIATSEQEATEDHLPAEKPETSTTEPEGAKEEEQHAETPAPTTTETEDVATEPARADAPAASATAAAAAEEDLVAAGPAVEATENAAEAPAASLRSLPSVSTAAEHPELGAAAEEYAPPTTEPAVVEPAAAPAVEEPDDIESPAEAFFTPAEEKAEEHPLSVEIPAIPEKSESRSRSPASPVSEHPPAEPVEDAVPVSATSGSAEEPVVVSKEEVAEETPEVPASVADEVLPAETPAAPLDETHDDAVTIQEQEESAFSTFGITATEAEESIVESREVVPVDPPVVLTKDEDTHSETHTGTATDDDADDEDDASSHTTDGPEPGITREDSVIPNGSDQKVSMPRLFPHNRQGNILQRVIESYIINGRSDWKIVQKYLPKPTASGDDSAAQLTKVIMTRMLEHCLSEAELTEGRVFMPILREQLAHFYWEDHKDKQAIKLWRKVLGDTANGDSDKFVYRARTNATRSLCNLYFTKALEAHIAGEDPSKYAKKLEEAAGRGADPVTTMWWYAHCSSLMLTAWHQMHDEDSYRALENFRFNAKCAIGKLESRASSNAESGFLLLAETLMTAADNWEGHVEGDESATRAMSLFLQHHYAVGLDVVDGDSSVADKAQTYGACETCDNELSWGHFQTCRYCKVDLCDSCHKSLEDTTLKVRVCSPIHDFFRTSGPAPHELPKDFVLLDGEQVHYKTWIAMLKEDWAL